MDLNKQTEQAYQTAVKKVYILHSPIFRIDKTDLDQEHKMLSEDRNKRLQYLIKASLRL